MFKMLSRKKSESEYEDRQSARAEFRRSELLQQDFDALPRKSGHAFVMIHVSNFHQLNSLFGTKTGESALEELFPLMGKFALEHNGHLYRLVTNRFAMLTMAEDKGRFQAELQKLCESMEAVCIKDKFVTYEYHYSFSYGIYFLEETDSHLDDIDKLVNVTSFKFTAGLGDADMGGVVFSGDERPDWRYLDSLTKEIHRAWEEREFVPYYQMIYDLKTRRPVGAELLTRWKHPSRGILLPKDFIPIMEAEGLIVDLDLYMLEEACKRIKDWIDSELVTVPIAVNISRLNLYRRGFVDSVISIVEKYDIPPILIELEVPELMLLQERSASSVKVWNKLHDYGFTLSMDNAAADLYSSVNLLRYFPIDVVKVKPSFFANITDSNRDFLFVQNIVNMAKQMKIKVVALDVETKEQDETCKMLGCELGQGYYFSRPETQEEFEKEVF